MMKQPKLINSYKLKIDKAIVLLRLLLQVIVLMFTFVLISLTVSVLLLIAGVPMIFHQLESAFPMMIFGDLLSLIKTTGGARSRL